MTSPDLALYIAAASGDLTAVEAALAAGARPGCKGGADDDTPLAQAAGRGDLPMVERLLAAGASPQAHDGHRRTPLMCAAQAGSLPIVQRLLAAGAGVLDYTHGRNSALSIAVSRGHVEIVRALVNAGASAQLLPSGDTPLSLAAREGHLEVVEALLALGVKVDAPGAGGRAPLIWARERGHAAVATRLLEAGATQQINVLAAIDSGDQAMLEAYIAQGGEVNALIGGELPLVRAARCGRTAMVRSLLEAGAKPNARDRRKGSALIASCEHDYFGLDVVELLLAARAKPHIADAAGRTPVWWAVHRGQRRTFERLVAAKAKPELAAPLGGGIGWVLEEAVKRRDPALLGAVLAAQKDRDTPATLAALTAAAELDDSVAIEALIAAGVPVGHTRPLLGAARAGKAAAVRALLAAGADPRRAEGHEHPLMAAAAQRPPRWTSGARDYPGVIEALIAGGADANLEWQGVRAIAQAAEAGVPETLDRLIALGARLDGAIGRQAVVLCLSEPRVPRPAHADVEASFRRLLSAGVDLGATDEAGQTALHGVAPRATPAHLRLLLEAGADPAARDHAGRTPLDCARSAGAQSAVAVLASVGA